MSPQILEDIAKLRSGLVPRRWSFLSKDDSGINTWLGRLIAHCDQAYRWSLNGRPKAFWLSGFFNPQVGNFMHSSTYTSTSF